MSPKEIHDDFIKPLVKKWAAEFRRGRDSVEDYEQSGYVKEVTTDEDVQPVHSLIMCDREEACMKQLDKVAQVLGQFSLFWDSSIYLDQYLRDVQGLS